MEHGDVIRLALVLAVQAEIEGMKAANEERKLKSDGLKYDEADYCAKADELRNISYAHEDQL